ncbi:bcl-2-associated transcription factor 1-like isoform X1 [Brienomyrus brachyistius]|uniref:bcl-2-associated transcription factor 1-like isoform X1 n=1 Tax=Brienomyrus brachyistius TaxID=42636 RepID=UPI0020B3DD2F|nr:bcl-2-associated transcription factor 1-like isoform X1 [Brienomyrus brachyistius]
MVRSKSHTHSSRSRSRSHSTTRSRSRSRSRKKRYSSRSRSRSYSRSRSRERNYPREYRRDYRPSRGMRRPYGFRNRGRGYYQGGGRFHHRGGFRPNWQNRRYSRSPRRGRSRSRTPKRRSTSQRSRSKSRRSGRSSASGRSSSSSSSSTPRNRSAAPAGGKPEGPGEERVGAATKGGLAMIPLAPPSEGWMGISAYKDNSPRRSPSPVRSPPSQSSSHSGPLVHSSAPPGSKVFFPQSDEQDLSKVGKYFKRCLQEGGDAVFSQDQGVGRQSEPQKVPLSERAQWSRLDMELELNLDSGTKSRAEKVPFLGDSPEAEEEDEVQAYRQPHQLRVVGQAREGAWTRDPVKGLRLGREPDRLLKAKEQGLQPESEMASPQQPKAGPQRPPDGRRDSAPRAGPSHCGRPQVRMEMTSLDLGDTSPSISIAGDRSLASTLACSARKEQAFRSIFHHITQPQAYKGTAEAFIHHVVSLVHHVRERHFRPAAMSLHERFAVYQTAAVEHEARHQSPEIHRRIDISPSAFKKARTFKEDSKGGKKSRCDSADLRYDIDRRRTEQSRDHDEARMSREHSPPKKVDKLTKEPRDYKPFKDESKRKSKERGRSRSSSESSVTRENSREKRRAREEEGAALTELKDDPGFQGTLRPRGTFQFRIRGGRGRGRGTFPPPISGPTPPSAPFQKRPKEEEWDPEYTPKSRKYFLHDDRDDGTDYWVKRGRGRGLFQRGRGRFPFRKSSSSPKWTHDKYQCEGNEEEEEEEGAEGEERKDPQKDEKVE